MSVVLSEQLPLLASAPEGIRKLRSLILELAMRGKLLAQDSKDEPASKLIQRINKERAQFETAGVCRKSKPTPLVGDDEQAFMLPSGWEWIRLGQIGDWGAGTTPSRSNPHYYGGTIPWFKSGELTSGFISKSEEHVTELALKECSLRQNKVGDVLIAMYGATIGKTAILATKATTNQAVCACTPNTGVFNRYLLLLLNALKSNFVGQGAGGAQPNISREKIIATVTALPPEPEQYRIVAKVDELMALCDRLEAEQADSGTAHARLVETLLGTLSQSADADELAVNWQLLAGHFDTLFATEAGLTALKQTILQLAVMGKLVLQDPSDEPAPSSLARIQKSRRFKRKCSAIDIDSLESPLPDIPAGWIWTVIDQIAADQDNSIADGPFGANLKTEHYISASGYRVVRLQNIGYGDFRGEHLAYVSEERYSSLHKHRVFSGDLVVAGLVDDRVRCCELPSDIGPALVKADCYRFCVHTDICSAFALHYLNSPIASTFAAAHHHGMTLTRIGLGNFRQLPFPLPPIAEQHRIVAKVDELMALCDRLKADLVDSRSRQARLADTLIAAALEAA